MRKTSLIVMLTILLSGCAVTGNEQLIIKNIRDNECLTEKSNACCVITAVVCRNEAGLWESMTDKCGKEYRQCYIK